MGEKTDALSSEEQLMSKIKDVVASQVKEGIDTAMAQAKVFVEGEGEAEPVAPNDVLPEEQEKTIKEFAMKNMLPKWKRIYADLSTKEEQKQFQKNVVIYQFLKALHEGDKPKAKQIANSMNKDINEGTDSAGGYLVPKVLSSQIYEIVTAQGLARREMTVVPMTSKTLDLTTLTTKVVIYYVNELAQITASDPVFGRKTLTAQKMAGITAMSNEIFEDGNIAMIPFLIKNFAEAFMQEEDKAFFNTSSSSGITGILEDTGVNIVTFATGETNMVDLTYNHLVDAIFSLDVNQRKGAQWCMSSDTMALVAKLKDTTGQPIWSMAREGIPSMLLGYPILENDQMPGTADDGVSVSFISFGNYKNYLIGDRRKVTSKVLTEATIGSTNLAEKDATGLVMTQRVSGIAPTPLSFVKIRTAAS